MADRGRLVDPSPLDTVENHESRSPDGDGRREGSVAVVGDSVDSGAATLPPQQGHLHASDGNRSEGVAGAGTLADERLAGSEPADSQSRVDPSPLRDELAEAIRIVDRHEDHKGDEHGVGWSCLHVIYEQLIELKAQRAARVDPSPLETEKVNADVETPDVLDRPARRASGISGAASDALPELRSGVQGLGRVDPSPLAQDLIDRLELAARSSESNARYGAVTTSVSALAECARLFRDAAEGLRAALLVPTQPTEQKED